MLRIPPRIGIDASRAQSNSPTGTENYSYQIIKAIASANERYDLLLYTKDSPSSGFDRLLVEYSLAQKRISWPYLWTQGGLALESWYAHPDLLFIPAHVIPMAKNPFVPAVVVVHDLRTEFLPQHSDFRQKFYLNSLVEIIRARLATHIIAVSHATKKDVVEKLGVMPEKVSVVYEGVDCTRFDPTIKQSKRLGEVMAKFKLTVPYILFVGTIQPRKNLVRLIEAFSQLPQVKKGEVQLILAGKKGWLAEEIYKAPQRFGVESLVRFINYVPDEDLPYLYAGAKSFAFPSLYEGFGLPILEALSMRIPVVTSKISSMPEVGGEYALYVDPFDTSSIASQLSASLSHLVPEAVVAHLQKFTWERAGELTMKVFDSLLRHE